MHSHTITAHFKTARMQATSPVGARKKTQVYKRKWIQGADANNLRFNLTAWERL